MKIQEIQINNIKPDPNQPRKSFDKKIIEQMAQSIKSVGILNPIEIDKKLMIVSGELRWRAAKKAGLKKVPCKIIKISKERRFMRQVISNMGHEEISSWDTEKALIKLFKLIPKDKFRGRGAKEARIRELIRIVGGDESWVREKLQEAEQWEQYGKIGRLKKRLKKMESDIKKKS